MKRKWMRLRGRGGIGLRDADRNPRDAGATRTGNQGIEDPPSLGSFGAASEEEIAGISGD
jgi:hypothetical protein